MRIADGSLPADQWTDRSREKFPTRADQGRGLEAVDPREAGGVRGRAPSRATDLESLARSPLLAILILAQTVSAAPAPVPTPDDGPPPPSIVERIDAPSAARTPAQTVSPSPPPTAAAVPAAMAAAVPAATPAPTATPPSVVTTTVPTTVPTTEPTAPAERFPRPVPVAPPPPAASHPKSAPTVLPKPSPAAAHVPAAPRAPAPGPGTSPAHGKAFGVHVSSFRRRATAEADARRLGTELALPARVLEADLGAKGVWYRVVVGEAGSAAEASALRARLAEKGIRDTIVVGVGPDERVR